MKWKSPSLIRVFPSIYIFSRKKERNTQIKKEKKGKILFVKISYGGNVSEKNRKKHKKNKEDICVLSTSFSCLFKDSVSFIVGCDVVKFFTHIFDYISIVLYFLIGIKKASFLYRKIMRPKNIFYENVKRNLL